MQKINFRHLDILGQTLLLGLLVWLLSASTFRNWPFSVMGWLAYIGPWQFVAGCVRAYFGSSPHRYYLIACLGFFLLLSIAVIFFSNTNAAGIWLISAGGLLAFWTYLFAWAELKKRGDWPF